MPHPARDVLSEFFSGALVNFVEESNHIEGILRPATNIEVEAHETFLALRKPSVAALERFVEVVAQAHIRKHHGMDVYIRGSARRLPPGGPHIRTSLKRLLEEVRPGGAATPFEVHRAYERLHPFTDGNGRSGRVLWLWHMRMRDEEPFVLPFMHHWYYQSFE